jgi:hypothetical protein
VTVCVHCEVMKFATPREPYVVITVSVMLQLSYQKFTPCKQMSMGTGAFVEMEGERKEHD